MLIMPDIKIFVCCHKKTEVPEYPLLIPIQLGTALTGERFPGFLSDNEGENISNKNRSYCELTAQYWAWKNVTADYYGFFHYRRYLYPEPDAKLPYRIERRPDGQLLDRLGYGKFAEMIRRYDIILPMKEDMHIPVRTHYAGSRYHHREDMDLMERIVNERFPEMTAAMDRYLSGSRCVFGNIFIMKREVFYDYCGWLFPILEEFDVLSDTSGYSVQEKRVDGYLAERLLGIYAEFCRENGALKTAEFPRVLFYTGTEFARTRLVGAVLPPGSRRRAEVRRKWMG